MSISLECASFLERISVRFPSREFLSEREVAELLGLRRATLKRWRRSGCAPRYARIQRNIRYRITDLLDFFERATVETRG